jgi:hypothetical protein
VSFSKKATPGTLSVTASNGCGTGIPRSISINMMKEAVLTGSPMPEINEIQEFKNTLNVYPNPGTGPVTFEFQIAGDAKVTVDIFSLTGQHIAGIFDENIQAGMIRTVHFDRSLPSGVYPCIMRWNGEMISTKMIVKK